ncbi:MAG: aspartate aminotransferase family protein [Pseudomonadota bacterium]
MSAAQSLFGTYNRAPIRAVRGEGVWLHDENGDKYLDFGSGIAVNVLGHAHPHLVASVQAQAADLWHTSNLYQLPGQERAAQRLTDNSFADRVFFCNSGAEALECAIKTARRYHYLKGNPERYRILTFEGAFHGRTLATIAAGGQAKYLEGFGPKVEGFDQVPFGDHDALDEALTDDVAAVLVEPVQGEGGLRDVPLHCLTSMRELCDDRGALLIYDEVQCGVGRTGRLFAHEHAEDATPDIMAVAKALGGGFPVGACLATADVADAMTPGVHGTTYGGNPMAMAACNAVMDIVFEDGFMDHVNDMALRLKQGFASLLDRHPEVFEEIRGKGLLTGLKCKVPNTDVLAALYEQRMLAVPAGDNVLRILPPLNVTGDEIADALDRLDRAAASLKSRGH